MMQLLQQAAQGWMDYIRMGKLAALLLASLLYLWFGRGRREQLGLLLYASAAAVCCILPVTAVLPMVYQTRFYDYVWIWSMVPMTAMTAYGFTVFLSDIWINFADRTWKKGLPVALLLLATVLLCGNLGCQSRDRKGEKAEREAAYLVLGEISEMRAGEEICLWAPREILEYAREIDATCRLLYGRNLWESSLNAYAYDVYDAQTLDLYQWMEGIGGEEEAGQLGDLESRVESALAKGADCILLPDNARPETVERMEKALGAEARRIEGYLVWMD